MTEVPLTINNIARGVYTPSVNDKDFGNFKTFMKNLLLDKGRLKPSSVNEILHDDSLLRLRQAFVHTSVNRFQNYERDEFVGDGFIYTIARNHVRKRFPNVTVIKELNKSYSYLTKKETLASIANRNSLFLFVKIGESYSATLKVGNRYTLGNKELRSLLEDTFEALIGELIQVIHDTHCMAVAYAVVTNILDSFFYQEEININPGHITDYTSRLKELMDRYRVIFLQPFTKGKNKKQVNSMYKTFMDGNRYATTLYYPTIDAQGRLIHNPTIIAKGYGENEKESEQDASKKAFDYFKKLYVDEMKKVDAEKLETKP